jgi:hypothetical protein
MTVRAFLGERFAYTHENQAFDQLIRLIDAYWGDREESVVLIGNVTCNAHEVDALLLKPDAIIVIDFKNFGGRVEFSENGPWLADGKEVKGGSKTNPFKQVQANKFAVMDWLNNKCSFLDDSNNLGHIAGLILFQQNIEFERGQLPAKIASWFHVADYNAVLGLLSQLASPRINLNRSTQERIVAALNVAPYQLPEETVTIVDLPNDQSKVEHARPKWTADQRRALELAERLFSQQEPDVLRLTGMASTGKTELVRELASLATAAGRDPVLLAPNAALAHHLSYQTGLECRSIFGYIYDFGSADEDSNDCIVHPLRTCTDAPDAVYIVDEAHLLSDAYFDIGGERFGSGHTVSDFLSFSGLGRNKSKLIVLGDPYQLMRGGEEYGLLSTRFLKSKSLKFQDHSLEQLIDDGSRSDILKTAVDLVSSIRSQCFSSLRLEASGPDISLLENADKNQALRELFGQGEGRDAVTIVASNQTAHKTTSWIRRNVHGCQYDHPQTGDRIELCSLLKLSSEEGLEAELVPHGSYGTVVSCEPNPIEHLQPLQGRDLPVLLRFRWISVQFDHEPSKVRKFLYLDPFLVAEKPELDSDTLVALRVYAETRARNYLASEIERIDRLKERAKSDTSAKKELEEARAALKRKRASFLMADPFYNAAKIRFAYASTCHHAQGRKWSEIIVDAGYDGQARANKGYFQWLYTALTRANGRVRLANFEPLSPMDNTVWRPQRVIIDPQLKSLFRLPYEKDRALSEDDLRRPVPEGFTDASLPLVNIWLYVSKRLDPIGLRIAQVKQYPCQEQYVVVDDESKQTTLSIRYNGQHEVTAVTAQGGDKELAARAMASLREAVRFDEPLAQSMLEALQDRLEAGGFGIEGGVLNSWHFRLTVCDTEMQRVSIKVHYGKDGQIGTVEAEKAVSAEVLEALGKVIQPNGKVWA